jgi:hypothetical protein
MTGTNSRPPLRIVTCGQSSSRFAENYSATGILSLSGDSISVRMRAAVTVIVTGTSSEGKPVASRGRKASGLNAVKRW